MDRFVAMQVFSEVAQTGSFTAAAIRLDMSRVMVTRYIGELEQWLGIRLLQRTTRSVTLTDAGEQTLAHCLQILTMTEHLTQAVTPLDGVLKGQLRMTCSMSLAYAFIAPVIADFLALHRALTIELMVSDVMEALVEQRIDLAIRISNEPDSNLITRTLGSCDSVLVATPDYLARQQSIPQIPADLQQHRCLGYANYGRNTWHLTKQGQQQTIPIHAFLKANEATILLQATLAGAGIALQPLYLVHQYLTQGQLIALLPDWQPEPLQIQALYASKSHLAPPIRVLLDYLVERFKQAPWLPPLKS